MTFKTTIKKKEMIGMEYSHSPKVEREKVEITYHIQVNPIKQYGSFEMYSDDLYYHAEGGLWFRNGELVDSDGIFELPQTIRTQLKEWGFEVW